VMKRVLCHRARSEDHELAPRSCTKCKDPACICGAFTGAWGLAFTSRRPLTAGSGAALMATKPVAMLRTEFDVQVQPQTAAECWPLSRQRLSISPSTVEDMKTLRSSVNIAYVNTI